MIQYDFFIMSAKGWFKSNSISLHDFLSREDTRNEVGYTILKCKMFDRATQVFILTHDNSEFSTKKVYSYVVDTGLGLGKHGNLRVTGWLSQKDMQDPNNFQLFNVTMNEKLKFYVMK